MSTPVMKIGNAERDSEGKEFLSSEPWTKMVSAFYTYVLNPNRPLIFDGNCDLGHTDLQQPC